MNCIGIDLGGMSIKTGLVRDGIIVAETTAPTQAALGPEGIISIMAKTALQVIDDAGLTLNDVTAIGVGSPGTVRSNEGIVACWTNLNWRKVPLCQLLSYQTNLPVFCANDADVAALGEVTAGSAKGTQSTVVITLGTGVGASIILKGAIWNGLGGSGSEFGHMVIRQGGRLCSCGRQGCFETYASATGLFVTVRELMAQYPDSLLHHLVATEGLHGYTPFVAATQGDACGHAIVKNYIDDLACGITNIINGLYPEVICLGGGIARQGEALLEPLRQAVKNQIYGGSSQPMPAFIACTLGNKAGIIGAAAMAEQRTTLPLP